MNQAKRLRKKLLDQPYYGERVLERDELRKCGLDEKNSWLFQSIWTDGLSRYRASERPLNQSVRTWGSLERLSRVNERAILKRAKKALRHLKRKTLRRKELEQCFADLHRALLLYSHEPGLFYLPLSAQDISTATHGPVQPTRGMELIDAPTLMQLDPRTYDDQKQQLGLLSLICAQLEPSAARPGPKANQQKQALVDHLCWAYEHVSWGPKQEYKRADHTSIHFMSLAQEFLTLNGLDFVELSYHVKRFREGHAVAIFDENPSR